MGKSNGTIKLDKIEGSEIEAFYLWLQGKKNPKIKTVNQPKLTSKQAFAAIYYLQEVLEILPDKYERCRICGCIYDCEEEGVCIDKVHQKELEQETGIIYKCGNYCGECRPDL